MLIKFKKLPLLQSIILIFEVVSSIGCQKLQFGNYIACHHFHLQANFISIGNNTLELFIGFVIFTKIHGGNYNSKNYNRKSYDKYSPALQQLMIIIQVKKTLTLAMEKNVVYQLKMNIELKFFLNKNIHKYKNDLYLKYQNRYTGIEKLPSFSYLMSLKPPECIHAEDPGNPTICVWHIL